MTIPCTSAVAILPIGHAQRVSVPSGEYPGLEGVPQKIGDVLHTGAKERPNIWLSIPLRHPSRLHKQVFSPHSAGFFLGDAYPVRQKHVECTLAHSGEVCRPQKLALSYPRLPTGNRRSPGE